MRPDGFARGPFRHDQHRAAAAHQRCLGEIAPGVAQLLAGFAANDQIHTAALLGDQVRTHHIRGHEAAPFMCNPGALDCDFEGLPGSGSGVFSRLLQAVDDLLGHFRGKLAVDRQIGGQMQPDDMSASWARNLEDSLQRRCGVLS